MRIGVLGMNFKSAEIGTRESVSKACQKQLSYINASARELSCVVLSTCNRTEIYFSAEDLVEAHSEILHLLREEIESDFEHKLYSYFGFDCFLHLAKVTSGLDSAIVAESEIQRQVKVAYEKTMNHYRLSSGMHFLFQKSLKIGKNIRTSLPLAQNQMTIAKILFEMSQQLLRREEEILFIGNSEINRQVMAYFRRKGIQKITLCTRFLSSVKEKERLSLLPWESLSSWQEYPLVICGSNAPHYLVSRPLPGLATRLIFDLSVPRNVDPSLARHPQLHLLNMEEIGALIEMRQKKNALEVDLAHRMVLERVQQHFSSFGYKERKVFVCA